MLQRAAEYIAGRVAFEVVGGQGERFMNACAEQGIPLMDICATPTGFRAQVALRVYPKLHTLARKHRCRLRMTQKRGVYLALWPYRKRWGILAGAALAILLLFFCTRLIWTVQFYHVTPEQETQLRAQLYEKGICEGSIVTTAQLKQAQNDLFITNHAYGWVKLNFIHGRLVVEKGDAPLPLPTVPQEGAYDVVALCDGQIERIELSAGNRVRTEGQYVSQGEVIVAGNYYTKRGTLFTAHAQAKVYARVKRIYEVRQPLQTEETVPQGEAESTYALWFSNRRIPLSKEQTQAGVQQIVVKYPLKLFGIPLPLTVEETRTRAARTTTRTLTAEQAADIARVRAYDCMHAELPELVVSAQSETVREEENTLILRVEIEGVANIAAPAPAEPAIMPKTE